MARMSGAEHSVGPLQQLVLEFVWEHPRCTVRDCLDALAAGGRDYAYTTVQTVFDVLRRKGLVERKLNGVAYCYKARQPRGRVFAAALGDVLARFGPGPRPVASSLVDVLEGSDKEALQALVDELRKRGYVE